jgi:RHS repeat-associated protein
MCPRISSLAIDDPLSVEQGSNIYYYHKDGLGSVTELTDANGNVVKTYDYKGFGEIHTQTGTVVQPFAFTSREYDSESGLYFYRGRYYDPKAGRFINRDPIGFAGGDVNLFRYVQNNPINFVDPEGLRLLIPIPSREEYGKVFPKWMPEWAIDILYEIDSDPTAGVGPPSRAGGKLICKIRKQNWKRP